MICLSYIQTGAGNTRLDYPLNHAATRSRGTSILAHKCSFKLPLDKWWLILVWRSCWVGFRFLAVDVPRACEGRAAGGCVDRCFLGLDSWFVILYHARAQSLLDYIETILTPPKIDPYPVRLSAFCIII